MVRGSAWQQQKSTSRQRRRRSCPKPIRLVQCLFLTSDFGCMSTITVQYFSCAPRFVDMSQASPLTPALRIDNATSTRCTVGVEEAWKERAMKFERMERTSFKFTVATSWRCRRQGGLRTQVANRGPRRGGGWTLREFGVDVLPRDLSNPRSRRRPGGAKEQPLQSHPERIKGMWKLAAHGNPTPGTKELPSQESMCVCVRDFLGEGQQI